MTRLVVQMWLLMGTVSIVMPLRAQETDALDDTLRRVGAYVENYFARAPSIVAQETVTVQQVTRQMANDGFAQRYVSNLRVEWLPGQDGTVDATLTRELITVNGRPPKAGDEPHCTAPRPITPEPLAMFLPQNRGDYVFERPERTRLDGQPAIRIDYRFRRPEADKVAWDRECVSMDLQSRVRGRVWVDDATGAVLRIDESVTGPVEARAPRKQEHLGVPAIVRLDRAAESIRYRSVAFSDPDETLLLPASIESLAMLGPVGTRRTQTYSKYRRFVTEGRIVE